MEAFRTKLPGNLGTGTGTPLFEKGYLGMSGVLYLYIYIYVIVTSDMHIDFFINYES